MSVIDKLRFISCYKPENGGLYNEPKNMNEWFMRQHIILEFKTLPFFTKYFFGFLNENNGHIKDITSYIDVFRNSLLKSLKKNWENSKKFVYVFDASEYEKTCEHVLNDPFLRNVVIVSYLDSESNKSTGSYIINDGWKKLSKSRIEIDLAVGDDDKYLNDARNIVGHEIIHAYEDWWRNKNGAESYYDDRYGKTMSGMYSVDKTEGEVARFLYLTTPCETNAFVGQILPDMATEKEKRDGVKTGIFGIFKQRKRKKAYDINDAMEDLEKTDAYKNYLLVKEYMVRLLAKNEAQEQKKCVDAYNRMCNTKWTTYNQFCKAVNANGNRFLKQFEDRACKCIREFLKSIKENIEFKGTVNL